SPSGRLFAEAVIYSEQCEFQAGRNPELVKGIREVMLDGLLADGKLLRDVPVAVSGHDGGNDFELPRGKAKLDFLSFCSGGRHELAPRLHQVGNALAAHPLLSPQTRLDALDTHLRGRCIQDDSAAPQLQGLDDPRA